MRQQKLYPTFGIEQGISCVGCCRIICQGLYLCKKGTFFALPSTCITDGENTIYFWSVKQGFPLSFTKETFLSSHCSNWQV